MQFYPTDDLNDGEIFLSLDHAAEAQPEKRWLPAYYFDICLIDGTVIGHCDLRIGHNEKTYIGGNIGYRIDEAYRGHHYAAKACRLLFRHALKHGMEHLIITCDTDNRASARTCELAGARFIEIAVIPEDNEMYLEGKRRVMVWRVELKYHEFLRVAKRFNDQLGVVPLLFGSLGLERRLDVFLEADDIDVLLPESLVDEKWNETIDLMHGLGYELVDAHEHEFRNGAFKVAFAAVESLYEFAGVDVDAIPKLNDGGADYLLLDLSDYLKVYEASSKDGYRRNVKHKQDQAKIELIKKCIVLTEKGIDDVETSER